MLKDFQVDWDSYEDMAKLVAQLRSRLGELNAAPKRLRNQQLLAACNSIFSTDITSVFESCVLDKTPSFYVYAHLDTSKRIAVGRSAVTTFAATLGMEFFPFYIGKGTGDRCSDTNRNETHRKIKQKLAQLGKSPSVIKIAEGLTELEALAMESKLIDIFGLLPYGGLLSNLDEGVNKDERRALYRQHFDVLRRMNQIL